MILRQLQCSGTVECVKRTLTLTLTLILTLTLTLTLTRCVKLMQSGYPNRAPYADLQSRFKTV